MKLIYILLATKVEEIKMRLGLPEHLYQMDRK